MVALSRVIENIYIGFLIGAIILTIYYFNVYWLVLKEPIFIEILTKFKLKRKWLDLIYIILNYKTYSDTIKLIDEISEQYSSFSYRIVVVDNCSPNISFKKFKKNIKKVIMLR